MLQIRLLPPCRDKYRLNIEHGRNSIKLGKQFLASIHDHALQKNPKDHFSLI